MASTDRMVSIHADDTMPARVEARITELAQLVADALTAADVGAPTNAQMATAISTALSALTTGSPAELDTFLETYNRFLADESALTALTSAVSGKAAKAANLSDLADAIAARTNLGLGTAATKNTGTASGEVPLLSTGGVLPIARVATGTPDGTKFVRDDGTLAAPAASSALPAGGTTGQVLAKTSNADGAASWSTPDVTQVELDAVIANDSKALSALPAIDYVGWGDSIMVGKTDDATRRYGDTATTAFALASGGRAQHLGNKGIGGQNSASILARFDSDIAPLSPDAVYIQAGTNDSNGLTQTLPNVKAMIAKCRSIGAVPILVTIPPAGMVAMPAPTGLVAVEITGGGTLAAGTYAYDVTALSASGETTASTVSITVSANSQVMLMWNKVHAAATYKVYGRTSGSKLLMSSVAAGAYYDALPTYTDTGATTPAGATAPVTNTSAPAAVSATTTTKIAKVNASLHRLAQTERVPLIDTWSLLIDSTTGVYKEGYTFDGTHPTSKAHRLMGNLAWAKAVSLFGPGMPYLARANVDVTNLLATANGTTSMAAGGLNPTLVTAPGQRPDLWSRVTTGNTGSYTETTAPDASVLGNAFTVARTDFSNHVYRADITSGFAVGDLIEFAFMIKTSGLDTGGIVEARLVCTGGVGNISHLVLETDQATWAPWMGRAVVPASTTTLRFEFVVRGKGVSASIAQETVRNLTALGIVTP